MVDIEEYCVSFPCSDPWTCRLKTSGSHTWQDSIFIHTSRRMDICLQALKKERRKKENYAGS